MLECTLDEVEAVVLDSGSHSLKIGFAGEDLPRSVVPSLCATVRRARDSDDAHSDDVSSFQTEHLIGNDAWRGLSRDSELNYPIQNGMIADKDATEDLWEAALKKFVAPETGDMVYLLTCPPLTSNASKEWIFEIFFEKFKCKRMALLQPGPLSLFSSGRSRGLVVEIGHSLTSAVPVFEGFPLAYATQRMFRAGGAITAALSQALAECSWFDRHLHLCSIPVMEDMKCRLCRVAVPNLHSRVLKAETPDFEERGFQLPDGSVIDLDQQVRFGPAELLFDDSIEVRDTPNLDEVPPSLQSELHTCETLQSLVHSAIATTDPEFQEEMRKNIVLAGGSSLLKNFANRLHGELLCIQPEEKDPFFIAADSHRRFSAWVGGSMLASLGTFEKFCISRHEYEDGGRPMADVIHERNVGR